MYKTAENYFFVYAFSGQYNAYLRFFNVPYVIKDEHSALLIVFFVILSFFILKMNDQQHEINNVMCDKFFKVHADKSQTPHELIV